MLKKSRDIQIHRSKDLRLQDLALKTARAALVC